MFDSSAAVCDGVADCLGGVGVGCGLFLSIYWRFGKLGCEYTHPHISIRCYSRDSLHFFRRELEMLQFISRRRNTPSTHYLDEIGSGSDLFSSSFNAIRYTITNPS